jgi:dihydrolipoamide dehydrogenase
VVDGSGHECDLAVVGAGPGGYVAAIRAAQLGLSVAIVEADRPGGVCLNWGCIPTKALLTGAELVESLRGHGAAFGICADAMTLDYGRAVDSSRQVAARLGNGVEALLRKHRVVTVRGRARLAGPNTLQIEGSDGVERIAARHIVLATGSSEWLPPGVTADGARVMTSTHALGSRELPRRLLVVGAGAVGIEFAYVYAMYGARVSVLEMADQVLPGADAEVAGALERELVRKGIEITTGARFEKIDTSGSELRVGYRCGEQDGELDVDRVLVAIGRRPNSADLGLEAAGIEVDARGFVAVDDWGRTSQPSVFAIGDLAGAPLLAHKASEQGIAVVEHIAGIVRPAPDPARIPSCVYAQPQVASIGLTEAAARERFGDRVRVGRFPFAASGKAVASGHTAGFAKLVIDAEYGEILGAHLVGAGATELIAEVSLAMTLEATADEVIHTVHAHPTLSEAIWESALAAEGRSIHS